MYPNINETARRACAQIHGGHESNQTRLEGLLSRYLPVSEMSLDELSSELSPATVATLCVDRTTSGFCGIVVDGMEEMEQLQPSVESFDLTLERVGTSQAPRHGFVYIGRVFDSLPFQVLEDPAHRHVEDDVYDASELHDGVDWDNWAYWLGEKEPRRYRQRPSRIQSGFKSDVLTPEYALANPSGQIAFADLIGGVVSQRGNPRPTPVRQWTNSGPLREPDKDWIHRISHDRLYIAPVHSGYSHPARRFQWFGRKFKFLNDKPREEGYSVNLGNLLKIVSKGVRDMLGEEYTQSTSVRPTGRGIIQLGESDAHCDLWPISSHVSLAIGIVSHSQRGSIVRTFRNWSQGKLGKSEHTSVDLDKDLASLAFNYVDRDNRGRGAAGRFVLMGAPEPVVNLTNDVIDKIINTIIKRTLQEKATIIVLEGI